VSLTGMFIIRIIARLPESNLNADWGWSPVTSAYAPRHLDSQMQSRRVGQ
jgi:hypothetical protein